MRSLWISANNDGQILEVIQEPLSPGANVSFAQGYGAFFTACVELEQVNVWNLNEAAIYGKEHWASPYTKERCTLENRDILFLIHTKKAPKDAFLE